MASIASSLLDTMLPYKGKVQCYRSLFVLKGQKTISLHAYSEYTGKWNHSQSRYNSGDVLCTYVIGNEI